jgi:hypothetical protein
MALKHILPKRPPILDTMLAISEQLTNASTSRRNYSRLLRSFALSLVTSATRAKAEATEKFSVLQSYYNEIADLQDNLANAESRTADDIRDIVERYVVLSRFTDEYNTQKELYEADVNALLEAMASQTVASRQPGYEKVKSALENRIAHAKLQKKFNAQLLIQKVKQLIVMRQKYSVFKFRRLAHGWRTYVQAKSALVKGEKTAILQIIDLLREDAPVQVEPPPPGQNDIPLLGARSEVPLE